MNGSKKDVDPATELVEEDEDLALPELEQETDRSVRHRAARRRTRAVARHAKLAPASPGVYRMIDAQGDVLYVGKAKNIRKRIVAYTRPTGYDPRIERMIAATATLEFVSTATETEALLLEANLIKRLRPRFNVLLRDDKSFPYILITADHWAPQILKHRGARTRPGSYYGPFASVWAVNRTITALQRAFLAAVARTASSTAAPGPACSTRSSAARAPAREIDFAEYGELVREANAFLSGKSQAVKDELAGEMEKASGTLDFERAAIYRDRLAALSAVQSHQDINPRGVEEADVFAVHQEGGFNCVEVFFFRTGQNWGNRAYFPKADRSLTAGEVLGAFCPVLRRQAVPALHLHLPRDRGARAAGRGAEHQERLQGRGRGAPARREEGPRRPCARQCARGARPQARRHLLAAQAARRAGRMLRAAAAAAAHRGLRQQPHSGQQRGRRHDRRRPGGVSKNQYRKFNIRSTDLRRATTSMMRKSWAAASSG